MGEDLEIASHRSLRLGDFVLELDEPELRRDGAPVEIHATPLRLLVALAERAGRVISKQDLSDTVWPGVTVSDASIATALRELRFVLGDDGREQRIIETLRNRGYRLRQPRSSDRKAPARENRIDTLAERGSADEPTGNIALLMGLGASLLEAGQRDESRRAYREAAGVARQAGDDGAFVRATLAFAGDLLNTETVVKSAEVATLLEEAITREGSAFPAERARLRARLAINLVWTRHDEAVALAHEAGVLAREIGDPDLLSEVLYDVYWASWSPDNVAERLALAQEMIDAANRADNASALGFGHLFEAAARLETGDRSRAEGSMMQGYDQLVESGANGIRVGKASWRACIALLDGRFGEAERFAKAALEWSEPLVSGSAGLIYAMQIAWLRIDQGRGLELAPFVREFAGELPLLRAGVALVHCEVGDLKTARMNFIALMDGFEMLPRDSFWLGTLTVLAEVAVKLADPANAARLHEALLPFEAHCALLGIRSACRGSVALYLGLLARTAERPDAVVPHLETAMRVNTRLRALPLLARTQLELAHALADRKDAGDGQRARSLLAECSELYRGLGLDVHNAEIAELSTRL